MEEETISNLYQKRLGQQLELIPNKMNRKWQNIRNGIGKVRYEVLGKRYKNKRRGELRIWNDGIQVAIQQKDKTYRKYLQKRTEAAKGICHEPQNRARAAVRQAHRSRLSAD